MGNVIVVCHWNNGGGWDAIEVAVSGLNGHDNHDRDIWPPVEGASEGSNWPSGEDIWLNGCRLEATPEPSQSPTSSGTASPSGSPSLPETGAVSTAVMSVIGVMCIAAGAWMKVRSLRG